jgi:hypothetical protein
MMIGEALNRRADLQKRVSQLQARVQDSVIAQEGEEPPEDPEQLMSELELVCDELERLIARINHTNAATKLPTGESVTEALARRDVLGLRAGALRSAIRTAADTDPFSRYSRSEIRSVRQVSVSELQALVDGRARDLRELDDRLQLHNWTTPLIE